MFQQNFLEFKMRSLNILFSLIRIEIGKKQYLVYYEKKKPQIPKIYEAGPKIG